MNRDDRVKLLAESLRAEASKAKEEQDQAAQVARVTELITAKLAGKNAETSKPMSCPSCGEPLPENWRTDDITSDSDSNDDPDNKPDGEDEDDDDDDDKDFDDRASRAAALKAKYANRKLSLVDRILVKRGIDPFTED
jgi:hypothetical protein